MAASQRHTRSDQVWISESDGLTYALPHPLGQVHTGIQLGDNDNTNATLVRNAMTHSWRTPSRPQKQHQRRPPQVPVPPEFLSVISRNCSQLWDQAYNTVWQYHSEHLAAANATIEQLQTSTHEHQQVRDVATAENIRLLSRVTELRQSQSELENELAIATQKHTEELTAERAKLANEREGRAECEAKLKKAEDRGSVLEAALTVEKNANEKLQEEYSLAADDRVEAIAERDRILTDLNDEKQAHVEQASRMESKVGWLQEQVKELETNLKDMSSELGKRTKELERAQYQTQLANNYSEKCKDDLKCERLLHATCIQERDKAATDVLELSRKHGEEKNRATLLSAEHAREQLHNAKLSKDLTLLQQKSKENEALLNEHNAELKKEQEQSGSLRCELKKLADQLEASLQAECKLEKDLEEKRAALCAEQWRKNVLRAGLEIGLGGGPLTTKFLAKLSSPKPPKMALMISLRRRDSRTCSAPYPMPMFRLKVQQWLQHTSRRLFNNKGSQMTLGLGLAHGNHHLQGSHRLDLRWTQISPDKKVEPHAVV